MALRLSDHTPAEGRAAGSAPRALAAPLADEAARALARTDVAGYGALFGRAAAIGDEQERYRARKELVERGLAAAGRAPLTLVPRLYATTARHAVEVLEGNPNEPVLLNYLGVCLYELGVWKPAETLFKAARRLMPELPHVARNLEQLRARLRSGQRPPSLPAPLRAALADLGKRAERVAGRAGPETGLTLSLCMIVKDEEEMLPACLEAAAPAVDEIVVVDTGSSDRTVEIAEGFGARVLHHEWTGSFAEARNVSLDAATGDWILQLDADEVLVHEDRERLAELKGRTWREAFYLVETHHTGELGDGTAVTHNALRVWRNRPGHRFEGRVHEQIAQHLPGDLPERFEPTGVRVEHYGYLGAMRDGKEKSRRNIELLERQVADGVDDPFLHFNLGSEHAAVGDSASALVHLRRSWDSLRGSEDLDLRGFVPALLNRLTKALRDEGELDAAERQASEGLEAFPGFTDLVLEQALVARRRGDTERARELYERCLEMGDAPSRYSPTVGCGTYLALSGLADMAAPAEAVALLTECLERHPGYLGAVLPLTAALLASGAGPGETVAAIEERVASTTPSVRFMLGTALYEAGHAAEAEGQFRAVLERQPDSGPARLALVECLLSQSRWDDAVEAARAVDGTEPAAVAAARSEVFALLASERAGEAGHALARARELGLPHPEAAVLDAWCALARGEEPHGTLPLDSAPLLGVILEALLRVEAIDAFAQLVPAVERLPQPWRARRELLAGIYLRRGFLESAADEWLAACEQGGPDAEALVGLAQVALARGMSEDARTFAEAALALDPQGPLAPAAGKIAAAA